MKRKITIFKYWLIFSTIIYLAVCFVNFKLLTPFDLYTLLSSLSKLARFLILTIYVLIQTIYYIVIITFVLPEKK